MNPKSRVATHPGEVLLKEFLVPLGVSQVKFAKHIDVPAQRVNEVIGGKRGVTPETAWLFAGALGTSPRFWLNLQSAHDLTTHRPSRVVRRLRRTD